MVISRFDNREKRVYALPQYTRFWMMLGSSMLAHDKLLLKQHRQRSNDGRACGKWGCQKPLQDLHNIQARQHPLLCPWNSVDTVQCLQTIMDPFSLTVGSLAIFDECLK
jgi:hypothetical protein